MWEQSGRWVLLLRGVGGGRRAGGCSRGPVRVPEKPESRGRGVQGEAEAGEPRSLESSARLEGRRQSCGREAEAGGRSTWFLGLTGEDCLFASFGCGGREGSVACLVSGRGFGAAGFGLVSCGRWFAGGLRRVLMSGQSRGGRVLGEFVQRSGRVFEGSPSFGAWGNLGGIGGRFPGVDGAVRC